MFFQTGGHELNEYVCVLLVREPDAQIRGHAQQIREG
jgi:hypothetical protein